MTSAPLAKQPFLPNLIAAALCALVTIAYAGSFGGLVFGGALDAYVGRAVLAALVSSIVVMVVLAWRSSFYFCLGGPDSNPLAILAFTFAAISGDILRDAGAGARAVLPTVLLFLFLSAFGCGVILYLLGQRRWGRYVRFLPHPVVGGFLAGAGYLLAAGAFKMLTGFPLQFASLGRALDVPPLSLAFVVLTSGTLVVLTRRVKHYLVIPSVLIVAVLLFHLARMALGLDLATARHLGLLLVPLQIGDWTNVVNLPYGEVRWDLVFAHGKDFAAMTAVALITTLLHTSTIELASGVEGDADRELKAVGLANMLAGLCGGMVAVNSHNRSLLNLRGGATSRWAAVYSAGLILAAMILAPGVLGLLPKPVLTGLILFLGVGLLLTWVVDARRQMPVLDHLLLLAILGIVIALGIVPGVVLGLIIACVSFVFTLSRSPSIRHDFTLRNRHSNVERPVAAGEFLLARGDAMRGFALQGSLFFGTTSRVLDEVRLALHDTRFVLLDFRLVHDLDGSSIIVFKKLQRLCVEAGLTLVFTDLSPAMEATLHLGGMGLDDPALRIFPDLDHGLEWCEEQILAETASPTALTEVFTGVFTAAEVAELEAHFPRVRTAQGERLVRQGDPSDAMFVIETGRVSVYLRFEAEKAAAARQLRLRTYPAGTVVGEMGFYTGAARSADIVADQPTESLELTAELMTALEREAPVLAHKLHRFIARSLSQRLAAANDEIRALI